eukprot:jgi/Mesen1/5003/ME000025S04407
MADNIDEEDEELQRAFRMSLAAGSSIDDPMSQNKSPGTEPPEAKRSRAEQVVEVASPPERAGSSSLSGSQQPIFEHVGSEKLGDDDKRRQRDLRAAAAERRFSSASLSQWQAQAVPSPASSVNPSEVPQGVLTRSRSAAQRQKDSVSPAVTKSSPGKQEALRTLVPDTIEPVQVESVEAGRSTIASEADNIAQSQTGTLSLEVAEKLYQIVFGNSVSPEVLAQWTRQGFRFSNDKETSLGLVQKEGGPCGVLAPIQALVMKYLLFHPADNIDRALEEPLKSWDLAPEVVARRDGLADTEADLTFSRIERSRALVRAAGETLWLAGGQKHAVVASIDIPQLDSAHGLQEDEQDELVAKALEGVTMDSPAALHAVVVTRSCSSLPALLRELHRALPVLRSGLGALLLLFSSLLSRTLDALQADRDDPEQPLVTHPFGHASQEIVNLLLSGQAVANVFDGSMDLGGGMCLKGIPSSVQVGFLTLLESLNLCKVGQHLKRPQWPVWVVGSESHYTVLFARSASVQDENESEAREARIRSSFDEHDMSGGGGFITPAALQKLLADLHIDMPDDMRASLTNLDIVVWNEFWQALLRLGKSRGGLKAEGGPSTSEKRKFEVYHFNGIAKSDIGGGLLSSSLAAAAVVTGSDAAVQRPRLTKLKVTVPPKWTPQDFQSTSAGTERAVGEGTGDAADLELLDGPAKNAQLVDCIRSRWQRASCYWSGDPPSIV